LVTSSIWTKLVNVNKNWDLIEKNNKYRDQIEYRILTLTCGALLGWHVDI